MRKGWILENLPETRAQALAILSSGIIPKHTSKITPKLVKHIQIKFTQFENYFSNITRG